MQEYDMVIKYKPGTKNQGPDFLSRNPVGPAPADNVDESIPIFNIGEVDFPQLQRQDDELSTLFKAIEHPSSVETQERRKSRRYVIKDNLLYKRGREPSLDLVMVPKSLQKKLIQERHNALLGGGHLGVAKCIDSLKSKYYWTNLEESVREFIKHCQHCQYRKSPNDKEKPGLLQPVTVEPEIFNKWGVDITGPLQMSNSGNKYVIAACEYLSGYLMTKAVKKVTSEDVCEFLMELVNRFGVPRRIVTDNGSNLVSKSVNLFLDQVGCRRVAISGYHPQSNGVIESCFKSLKNMMTLYVSPNHKDWDTFLPGLTFTLNSCVRMSRGKSPFEIVHGVVANLPSDVDLLPEPETEEIDTRIARMRAIRELTAEYYNSGKEKQKQYYDRNRKPVEYDVGDLVMLYSPRTYSGRCRKLTCHWTGPFTVVKVFNDSLNYVIKDVRSTKEQKVHVGRLKRLGFCLHNDHGSGARGNVSPGKRIDNGLERANSVRVQSTNVQC
ncbi:hypothetical protein WDU94_001882 [Cyamophila willieti]